MHCKMAGSVSGINTADWISTHSTNTLLLHRENVYRSVTGDVGS